MGAARWGAAILLGLASVGASAEMIANTAKGYAFEVGARWRLASPDFMLEGPDGASLMEADIPAQKSPTLEQISKTAGMIACIGADYTHANENFPLKGEQWSGLVTVFVEPRRHGRPPRHVLQLVAQHGSAYRLFYYAVPSQQWKQDRESATRILQTLRFI